MQFYRDGISIRMPRDNSFNKLVQLLETIDPTINQNPPAIDETHEGGTYMAVAQVAEIIRNAQHLMELLEQLPEDTCLEPWQQSKLTLANDYLEGVKTAMSSPEADNQEGHPENNSEIEIEPTEIEIKKA
jgi:hypothetical protein